MSNLDTSKEGNKMALKNILLLMTDQHRLDYTGYGGSNDLETPHIDRIAGSVGFTNCQTVDPICTPARTALITGRYPHQIGTLSMSGDLSLQIPTFMQALQKTGYYTAGIGKFHFLQTWPWGRERGKGVPLTQIKDRIKEYGYDYIWETSGKQLAVQNYCDYCEYLDKRDLLEEYRNFVVSAGKNSDYAHENTDPANPWPFETGDYVDVVTADKIIEVIKQDREEKPFYIFGSFCSPHKPYDPPQEYLDKIPYIEEDNFILEEGVTLSDNDKKKLYKQRRASRAMIKLIDDQIGRIFNTLEELNILDDTVILFTSDHGDMLGDHGRLQKAIYWKQACTVPAGIRHPDYLTKTINSTPVELTDFAATILDVAGLDPAEALSKEWPAFNNIIPSRSLMPILRGESDRIREYSFSECSGQWEMLCTENYKYVIFLNQGSASDRKEELYNLIVDPDEKVNVISQKKYKDVVQDFREKRIFLKDQTPPAQTSWAPLIN
jgi:arylsulfatase